MTLNNGILQDRRQALENEFYHKVDQELLNRLREETQQEHDRRNLAEETGLTNPELLDELVSLHLNSHSLLALSLIPLVRVAWADRVVDQRERDAVLRAADEAGVAEQSLSYSLLRQWLLREPRETLWNAWKHYVQALRDHLSPDHFRTLRDSLQQRARQVAESSGGFLGLYTVSGKEEAVLGEIGNAFPVPDDVE